MSSSITTTQLWQDASRIPDALARVRDDHAEGSGSHDVERHLSGRDRIVVLGNGAAYYAGLAMQMASWRYPGTGVEVVAVPAGVAFTGGFTWRNGDGALVISSSGSLRDVVELVQAGRFPERFALVTASPGSALHRAAAVSAVLPLPEQHSLTHTCAYLANVYAVLLLYRSLAGVDLCGGLDAVAETASARLEAAPSWAHGLFAAGTIPRSGMAFAHGAGLPAALETALLLKEVSGIYTEGMDTREGATSGMYALDDEFLVLAHAAPGDPVSAETERVCSARGARTLAVPGVTAGEELLAPITTFPAALALAIALGTAGGRDVDRPAWAESYFTTARTDETSTISHSSAQKGE